MGKKKVKDLKITKKKLKNYFILKIALFEFLGMCYLKETGTSIL